MDRNGLETAGDPGGIGELVAGRWFNSRRRPRLTFESLEGIRLLAGLTMTEFSRMVGMELASYSRARRHRLSRLPSARVSERAVAFLAGLSASREAPCWARVLSDPAALRQRAREHRPMSAGELRRLLPHTGASLKALAAAAGISPCTLSRILAEGDDRMVPQAAADRLCLGAAEVAASRGMGRALEALRFAGEMRSGGHAA